MRHRASLLAEIEGIGQPVFRIAHELSQNSRSGLTVRFLSKKLELPEEEIEYLVDVHHKLLYTDLTKIKLPKEGVSAVKRISIGLENRGDIESLYRLVKGLAPHDFRWLEDQLEIDKPGPKKAVVDHLLETWYKHPDSVVEYVATRNFSPTAREVFDIVWQSSEGIMPVSQIRTAHGGSEQEVEQALWELFRGFALFEMFRFDAEDRLMRVAGLLSELRQWRDSKGRRNKKAATMREVKDIRGDGESRGIQFTDLLCQLVAAIAAKPARLRGDGDLFREDMRRLSKIVDVDAEPSLSACLWAAEGVGWLNRVDNELHAADLSKLVDIERYDRHKQVFNWMMSQADEKLSRRLVHRLAEEMKPGAWYKVDDFVAYAVKRHEESEPPVLKLTKGKHAYVSPGAASGVEKNLHRSMEESLFWLGTVERAMDDLDDIFRISDLGRALLSGANEQQVAKEHSRQKSEIVVQPNFDIVVPTQDMDPLLTVPLDQFAVRQSSGQATVYHLSKDSFTQGLQNGGDGEAFVEFLMHHNRGGALPANVMATMEDWRGGIRRARFRTIHVLETDDPLVMADLQHRRKFKKYLKEVDPKRVIGYEKISKAELAKELEKDGFIVE